MTEKPFLVKMDDSLTCRNSRFMYGVGRGCTALYSGDLHECDGILNDRPEWCPLVEVDCTDIAGKQFHVRYRK